MTHGGLLILLGCIIGAGVAFGHWQHSLAAGFFASMAIYALMPYQR